MLLVIIGASALRRSLRAGWRLSVAAWVEVDNINPHPLRPIPKGTLALYRLDHT